MGIKLEFDKPALYQWDLNMRVILTDIEHIKAGIEVHFSSMYKDIECKISPSYIEDGNVYADVPNSLLQNNDILSVYLYVQDDNKAWTEYKTEILVLPRKKPTNYVYNETEVLTFKKLREDLEKEIAAKGTVKKVNGFDPNEEGNVDAFLLMEFTYLGENDEGEREFVCSKSYKEIDEAYKSKKQIIALYDGIISTLIAKKSNKYFFEFYYANQGRKIDIFRFHVNDGDSILRESDVFNIGDTSDLYYGTKVIVDAVNDLDERMPDIAIAEVGQMIVVKTVDENGKPTEWKAVDVPTGGASRWADIEEKPFDEVDSEISEESENPVQNKVVKKYVDTSFLDKQSKNMIITLSSTTADDGTKTYSVDKTFEEITEAYNNGVNLYVTGASIATYIPLYKSFYPANYRFLYYNGMSMQWCQVVISSDNQVVYSSGTAIASRGMYGGVRADAKTDIDTVPVKIGTDGNLYVPTYPSSGASIEIITWEAGD